MHSPYGLVPHSAQAFTHAFAKLNVTGDQLLANTDLLCTILQYHIVATVIPASAATETPQVFPTLLPGANLTIQDIK